VDGVDEVVQMRQPIFYNSDLRTQKRKHDEYDEEYDKGRIKKVKANNIQQEEQQNHQNGTIKKNIFQDAQSFKNGLKNKNNGTENGFRTTHKNGQHRKSVPIHKLIKVDPSGLPKKRLSLAFSKNLE